MGNKIRSDQVDNTKPDKVNLDGVLHLPSFIENNIYMNPFIELTMTIEGKSFQLDKNEEEIVER